MNSNIKKIFHKNYGYFILLFINLLHLIILKSINQFLNMYLLLFVINIGGLVVIILIKEINEFNNSKNNGYIHFKYEKIFCLIFSSIFINYLYDGIKNFIDYLSKHSNINILKIIKGSIFYFIKTPFLYSFIIVTALFIFCFKDLFDIYLFIENIIEAPENNKTYILTVKDLIDVFDNNTNNIYIRDNNDILNFNSVRYKYNNCKIRKWEIINNDLYITIKKY